MWRTPFCEGLARVYHLWVRGGGLARVYHLWVWGGLARVHHLLPSLSMPFAARCKLNDLIHIFHFNHRVFGSSVVSNGTRISILVAICYVFCNKPNSQRAHLFIFPTLRTTHIVLVSTSSTRTLQLWPAVIQFGGRLLFKVSLSPKAISALTSLSTPTLNVERMRLNIGDAGVIASNVHVLTWLAQKRIKSYYVLQNAIAFLNEPIHFTQNSVYWTICLHSLHILCLWPVPLHSGMADLLHY